ncbi:uncharacterized protein LOC118180243 [Stegodyphus dumicola]|uniref:uncharacterized protein LOC118180243 n=1 Tax=Stegodyphus dumicola TaxID=202533 RepID=UPI0015B17387|nr:uncharacterized protein LOC118180243 [Stegodyphus dumicola]
MDHRNLNLVQKAWEMIAEDTNCGVKELQYRWKCIRRSYIRYKKTLTTRSGDGAASKIRKFPLAEQMAFLEDTIRHRRTRFNVKPAVDGPSCSNASLLPVAEEEILSSQDLFDNEEVSIIWMCPVTKIIKMKLWKLQKY